MRVFIEILQLVTVLIKVTNVKDRPYATNGDQNKTGVETQMLPEFCSRLTQCNDV